MKRRYRFYIETSFWDRLADTTNVVVRRLSYRFLTRVRQRHDILISPLVFEEVRDTPVPAERRLIERRLRETYRVLVGDTARAQAIARSLMAEGHFGLRMLADLTHVGYAIRGNVDALVTWDVRTLAREKVRTTVHVYCRREQVSAPLIGTPLEVARWFGLTMHE